MIRRQGDKQSDWLFVAERVDFFHSFSYLGLESMAR
jgi:hypothetical protein